MCERVRGREKMSIDKKAKIETNINQFVLKYDFIRHVQIKRGRSYFLRGVSHLRLSPSAY